MSYPSRTGSARRLVFWCAFLAIASTLFLAAVGTAGVPAYAQTTHDSLRASVLGVNATTEAPNVTKHSKADIISRLKNNAASLDSEVSYDTKPLLYSTPGKLSSATNASALKMLNNIRYVAGLEDVSLNASYGELAQAGAFVSNSLFQLTHTPIDSGFSKPDGMPDSLWTRGDEGAGRSNLAAGYSTLNAAVLGWMSDDDESNIDRVGHRRWCINPSMAATGFGASNNFYAMYAFDNGFSSTKSNVAWPAQTMPVEFFNDTDPWSLSVGEAISDPSAVKVTLTRTNDGKSWAFSNISASTPSDTSEAYFNINNGGYGQTGCIIFRPANISYKAGDVFHVNIAGVNGKSIAYDVEFFAGYPVTSISFSEGSHVLAYSGEYLRPNIIPSDAQSYQITWKSSDPSVVSVSADGRLTKGKAGMATITATVGGAYTATGANVSGSVKVIVPKEINRENYDISFTNLEYTGSPVKAKAKIVDKETGEVLNEGTDYVIETSQDIVNAGDEATAWIWGKGAHESSGAYGYYIQVEPRKITSKMLSVSKKSLTYNGAKQAQSVALTFNGKKLIQKTDYTVAYANNVNAGVAKVTVTGTGNFTGSASGTFAIAKASLDVPKAKAGLVYNTKTQAGVAAGTGYAIKGNKAKAAGSYTAKLTADANHVFANGESTASVKWSIGKASQKISAKNASAKAKAKKSSKTKALAKSVAVNLKTSAKVSAKTKVAYKKANKAGGKKITVNAKTGKVTLGKGLKAGTYKVKVKLAAAADKNFKAAKAKYIVLTVKVG